MGTTARFYTAVSDTHLARIIKIGLSASFTYDIDERTPNRVRMTDGSLILLSNMPDHTPDETVQRYKALADVEWDFRRSIAKSEG